jgi:hypothetical protein
MGNKPDDLNKTTIHYARESFAEKVFFDLLTGVEPPEEIETLLELRARLHGLTADPFIDLTEKSPN